MTDLENIFLMENYFHKLFWIKKSLRLKHSMIDNFNSYKKWLTLLCYLIESS